MKITMESTDQTVKVGNTIGRVWVGKTERGVPVQCLVLRVAVHKNEDQAPFQRELTEQPDLELKHGRAFDIRLFID